MKVKTRARTDKVGGMRHLAEACSELGRSKILSDKVGIFDRLAAPRLRSGQALTQDALSSSDRRILEAFRPFGPAER